jgi:tetratricopeptide (TPR) repeat protein
MKLKIINFIKRNPTLVDLSAIIILWIISLIVINPIGNFPLNDDWAWGTTVRHLTEDGQYIPTDWGAMSLISQVIWGAIFCLPFGFSFTALRISTLVISLIGVIGIYLIFRNLKLSRHSGIIAALLLGFNPIYYALSNTFMTDVPFTSMMIIALLFFIRYLKNNFDIDLLLGSILAGIATLDRQSGIIIPIAFMLTGFFNFKLNFRWFIRFFFPLILSAGVLFYFNHWLKINGRMPSEYNNKIIEILKAIPSKQLVLNNLLDIILYLGWFSFPLLLFSVRELNLKWIKKNYMIASIYIVSFLVIVFIIHAYMPDVYYLITTRITPQFSHYSNIIVPQGIGPLNLQHPYIRHIPNVPELPNIFWNIITLISIVGGILLIVTFSKTVYKLITKSKHENIKEEKFIVIFILLLIIIYVLPLLNLEKSYDRYILPILPLVFIITTINNKLYITANKRFLNLISKIFIFLFILFSVPVTRDYLEWNRTRWKAIDFMLNDQKISPHEIDGGFEFNGLYLYSKDYSLKTWKSRWVDKDKYIVALGEIPGYSVFKEYIYFHLLPPCKSKIFILKSDLEIEKKQYSFDLVETGNRKNAIGDYKGAISDYNKAIEINPKNTEAFLNRGIAKYGIGFKQEAMDDYNKVIELNPLNFQAYNYRGFVRYRLEDKQGALQDFNKVIEMNPKSAWAYYNRGSAKYFLGDKEGGCSDWEISGVLGFKLSYEMITKYCK